MGPSCPAQLDGVVEHGAQQRQDVADGLGAAVDLRAKGLDDRNVELVEAQRAKGGLEVRADDALVVLTRALVGGSIGDPHLAEVIKGLDVCERAGSAVQLQLLLD